MDYDDLKQLDDLMRKAVKMQWYDIAADIKRAKLKVYSKLSEKLLKDTIDFDL